MVDEILGPQGVPPHFKSSRRDGRGRPYGAIRVARLSLRTGVQTAATTFHFRGSPSSVRVPPPEAT